MQEHCWYEKILSERHILFQSCFLHLVGYAFEWFLAFRIVFTLWWTVPTHLLKPFGWHSQASSSSSTKPSSGSEPTARQATIQAVSVMNWKLWCKFFSLGAAEPTETAAYLKLNIALLPRCYCHLTRAPFAATNAQRSNQNESIAIISNLKI